MFQTTNQWIYDIIKFDFFLCVPYLGNQPPYPWFNELIPSFYWRGSILPMSVTADLPPAEKSVAPSCLGHSLQHHGSTTNVG